MPKSPTKKCKHYCRTWYRGGTPEACTENWRCDGCGQEGTLDTMVEETKRVAEKKKNGRQYR